MATLAVSNTATSTALAVTAPSGYTHTDFAKYALEVCPGGTRTGCTSVDCLPADAAACRVSGLTPSTTYDIRVAAVKSGVAGAWSSTVATTTTCASSCPEYTTCPDSGVGCVCNRGEQPFHVATHAALVCAAQAERRFALTRSVLA